MIIPNEAPYWLFTERSYHAYLALVKQIKGLTADQIKAFGMLPPPDDDDDDDDGDSDDDSDDDNDSQDQDDFNGYDYMVSRVNNVALVQVNGHIASDDRWYHKYVGITSYSAIVNALTAAADHPGVDAAILMVDSGGGSAKGADEASTEIKRIDHDDLPVYAYNAGQMCSGAYWLGSAARRIASSRLAMAGSIGVLAVHTDISAMLKMDGEKKTILSIGEHKADGNPFEPLSKSAKETMLSEMQQIYDVFAGTVSANRGISLQDINDQQALVYMGAAARDHGLIDQITPMNRFIEAISTDHSRSRNPGSPESRNTQVNAMTIKNGVSASRPGAPELNDRQKAALAAGAPMADVLKDPELTKVEEPAATGDAPADPPAEPEVDAGKPADPPAEPEKPEAAVGSGSFNELEKMSDRLSTVLTERAELKAEVADLKRQVERASKNTDALKDIAVESIRRMQVAMGGVPLELSDMDLSTVVAQHYQTERAFTERFKVGATAERRKDSDLSHEKANDGEANNGVPDLGPVSFI